MAGLETLLVGFEATGRWVSCVFLICVLVPVAKVEMLFLGFEGQGCACPMGLQIVLPPRLVLGF